MRPVTSAQMSQIDKDAQEVFGLSQHALMENAGRASFEEIARDYSTDHEKCVAIFSGAGNNGGDGCVLARHLHNAGYSPVIYVDIQKKMKKGAARDNFRTLQMMGIKIYSFTDFLDNAVECEADCFVDALFGTGFKGSLPEVIQDISQKLKGFSGKVISLDIPSGLDATSGMASINCFHPEKTITFGLPKIGFNKGSGPEICGKVVVKDIGFPRKLLQPYM